MEIFDYKKVIEERIDNFTAGVGHSLNLLEDHFTDNNKEETLKLVARIAHLADNIGAVPLWREAVMLILESRRDSDIPKEGIKKLRDHYDDYLYNMEFAIVA